MAQAPQRRCTRCKQLHRGACPTCKPKHRREQDARRPNAHRRGYTRTWRAASKAWLEEHPLCVECERNGKVRAAECVDHVIPHRGDITLFWSRDNWASLCARCHAIKTAKGQ